MANDASCILLAEGGKDDEPLAGLQAASTEWSEPQDQVPDRHVFC